MEVEVSLDNLTVIAHDTPLFDNYLKESPNILGGGASKNYAFRYAYYCMDGSYIEHAENGKMRIEFNPNKANMDMVEEVLSTVRYPYLTRMDIAVDYFGENLSEFEWEAKTRRKKTYTYGLSNRLETLYIGSRSSERMYRIYDKLQERKDNEGIQDPRADNGHWRVEVQQRFSERETSVYEVEDYFQNYFSDIYPHEKDGNIDLSFIEKMTDRVMVKGLLSEPTMLNELSLNTRRKYKPLMEEARQRKKVLEISPAEAYQKEKSRLVCTLSELLNKTISYVQV